MYWPLKHAKWNGCTPTDLVFPFFLLAVGAAIPFSIRNGIQEFPKILKRSTILIFLGLFLNFFGEWSFSELRFPGVLQRIGFTYFFCALIYRPDNRIFRTSLTVIILIGYWVLIDFIPPPGSEIPTMSEGKDWGAWLDRFLFGEKHLWRFGKVWDPEGFLTSVSAIGSVMVGIFFGEFLKDSLEKRKSLIQMAAAFFLIGVFLFLVGGLWGLFFPINKSLWTSTYTLWTGGYAAAAIFVFLLLETRNGIPLSFVNKVFLPFGKNALLVFFGSGIFARSLNLIQVASAGGKQESLKNFIYVSYYKSWINSPELASFTYTITVLIIWFLILTLLDRKKIYWKI